jgi:hypothetical protein
LGDAFLPMALIVINRGVIDREEHYLERSKPIRVAAAVPVST